MDRKEFIVELKSELYEYEISAKSIDEVVEDYEILIDEAVMNGEIESDFISKLGSPRTIARKLSLNEKRESGTKHKLIAVSPFVSLILFFILGMQLNLWHPGWLVFLLVPISGVLLGARLDLKTQIVGLSPFIATIIFVLYGDATGNWHPAWIVFFMIPALGTLFEDGSKRVFGLFAFAVTPILYLFMEFSLDIPYSWLIFAVPVIYGLYSGNINISVTGDEKMSKEMITVSLAIGVLYVVFGALTGLWHPGWLVFLAIPVYAMFRVDEVIPLVAYTPFIATALFILVGEFFNAYAWSWILFLIIPIAGIFTDNEEVGVKVERYEEDI